MSVILVVASAGGHLTQARSAIEGLKADHEVKFCTTRKEFFSGGEEVFEISDFSRENPLTLFRCVIELNRILKSVKPSVVISTGAAPGLLALTYAKLIGLPTIWLDSCANVERLSVSGRLATLVADVVFTQWRHLESRRVKYVGAVI